jgi:hypothetical protein
MQVTKELRGLMIRMVQTIQEHEAQAKGSYMVIEAIKRMPAHERAALTPEHFSQMHLEARKQVYPLIAESARPLLQELQGEGDFLFALQIYLGP